MRTCETCKWFRNEDELFSFPTNEKEWTGYKACTLMPEWIGVYEEHYCGQHKDRTNDQT